MRCPRDDTELNVEQHRGIEVDRCPTCEGIWLDYHELSDLEHKAMPDEDLRGTLVYSPRPSGINCPSCQEPLTEFQYRARNLELDLCENGHGYWLDHGEDKQVLEFLKERIKNLERSYSAEQKWHQSKRAGRSRSLWDRIKGIFTGR